MGSTECILGGQIHYYEVGACDPAGTSGPRCEQRTQLLSEDPHMPPMVAGAGISPKVGRKTNTKAS